MEIWNTGARSKFQVRQKKRLNMKKKHLSFFHKTQKLHFFSLIEEQNGRERGETESQADNSKKAMFNIFILDFEKISVSLF